MPEKTTDNSKTDDHKEKKEPKKEEEKETTIDVSKIESHGAFLSKGRPGKIFLIGSSEVLKDNVVDPNGESPNAMFVMNILDGLNDREDIAAMRSKEQRFNPLNESAAVTKTFIKTFNIAGLPVLVVFFGGAVWVRRRSRKKMIQMMFQK